MGTGVSLKRIATGIFLSVPRPAPYFRTASGIFLLSFRPSMPSSFQDTALRLPDKQTVMQPPTSSFPRKEVIQPHLPIRLPCYDFTPVIRPAFGGSLLNGWVTDFGHFRLPWCDGRCVQDPGTYSPQHADLRLLAIPASCSRVADYNPNWDVISGIRSASRLRLPLFTPL